jgi:hypothetical protein
VISELFIAFSTSFPQLVCGEEKNCFPAALQAHNGRLMTLSIRRRALSLQQQEAGTIRTIMKIDGVVNISNNAMNRE